MATLLAQVEVDTLHRLSDSDYLRLCATDGVDDILARCGVDDSLWALPGAQ